MNLSSLTHVNLFSSVICYVPCFYGDVKAIPHVVWILCVFVCVFVCVCVCICRCQLTEIIVLQ